MDCKYCNFTGKTLDKLNQHMNTKRHSKNVELYNKNKILECQFCKKTFLTKNGLKYHEKVCEKKSKPENDRKIKENLIIEEYDNKNDNDESNYEKTDVIIFENKITFEAKEIQTDIILLKDDEYIIQSDDNSFCTIL
jgi:hypothetical protein